MQFILFFTIVFAIYFSGNLFIFRKGRNAIISKAGWRKVYDILYWLWVISFPLGKFLEQVYPSVLTDIIVRIGSIWLAFMLYFFIAGLIIALLRLLNRCKTFMPSLFFKERFKRIVLGGIIIVVTILITIGFYNARHPIVRNVEINIPKQAGDRDSLRAVIISDIHLSSIVNASLLQRIVKKINTLNPEIVFIPGDLVDGDLEPVLRRNSAVVYKEIEAPLGVYATTGNHEFIGGVDKAVKYLEKQDITFLRDTTLFIDSSFYLLGREDREMNRFEDKERKQLKELIKLSNKKYPLILLDHQPYYLGKAAEAGVDLQLSRHTHNGQLWPINYITSAMFDISYGYGQIDQLQIYVSSGAGTWGPPVRIGSRPEIINMKISFKAGENNFPD